mmetsp:Transcript_15472/g.29788  ORF Transcript_15472/g.29788 Transcript_15472/m.29788 type:complete len:210 (+) Transcript_15472:2692-3321(+)
MHRGLLLDHAHRHRVHLRHAVQRLLDHGRLGGAADALHVQDGGRGLARAPVGHQVLRQEHAPLVIFVVIPNKIGYHSRAAAGVAIAFLVELVLADPHPRVLVRHQEVLHAFLHDAALHGGAGYPAADSRGGGSDAPQGAGFVAAWEKSNRGRGEAQEGGGGSCRAARGDYLRLLGAARCGLLGAQAARLEVPAGRAARLELVVGNGAEL